MFNPCRLQFKPVLIQLHGFLDSGFDPLQFSYLDDGFQTLQTRLATSDSPRAGIHCWLQQMVVPGCGGKRNRGCFAVKALVELGPHDEEAAARLKKHFDRLEQLLSETIARGQECGELRSDKSASELAEFVMTIVSDPSANCSRALSEGRSALSAGSSVASRTMSSARKSGSTANRDRTWTRSPATPGRGMVPR